MNLKVVGKGRLIVQGLIQRFLEDLPVYQVQVFQTFQHEFLVENSLITQAVLHRMPDLLSKLSLKNDLQGQDNYLLQFCLDSTGQKKVKNI